MMSLPEPVRMSVSDDEQRLGLLLVGHGTRDERGLAEFRQTADALRQLLPSVSQAACFLELPNRPLRVACGNSWPVACARSLCCR